jgi:hypothetical protein
MFHIVETSDTRKYFSGWKNPVGAERREPVFSRMGCAYRFTNLLPGGLVSATFSLAVTGVQHRRNGARREESSHRIASRHSVSFRAGGDS